MLRILGLAAFVFGSPTVAAPQTTSATIDAPTQVVCKNVVAAQRGSKPFQMCLTKSAWAEREAKDSQNANRIVCRYEEVPGDRFRSKKICQSASAWAERRRLDREEVEKIQRSVCVSGGGC